MQFAFSGARGARDGGADAERRSLAMAGSRRSDLRLERRQRRDQRRRGAREPARPQARRARRAGGGLARRAAPARPRPLFARARRAPASALRPDQPRAQAARRRRPLLLVHAEGAAGGERRRRGRARGRLARRRHRAQVGRGAHAPRRHPRQSDRPAQSRAVPRPPRHGRLSRAEAGAARPVVLVIDIDDFKRVNDSYGLSMGDSTLLAIARRLVARPQAGRHAGAPRAATSSA